MSDQENLEPQLGGGRRQGSEDSSRLEPAFSADYERLAQSLFELVIDEIRIGGNPNLLVIYAGEIAQQPSVIAEDVVGRLGAVLLTEGAAEDYGLAEQANSAYFLTRVFEAMTYIAGAWRYNLGREKETEPVRRLVINQAIQLLEARDGRGLVVRGLIGEERIFNRGVVGMVFNMFDQNLCLETLEALRQANLPEGEFLKTLDSFVLNARASYPQHSGIGQLAYEFHRELSQKEWR